MGEATLSGLARPHLSDTAQGSGWSVQVSDDTGKVVDVLVVHPRDIGPEGDEAAIRNRLARHYDVSGTSMTSDAETTDDGLPETVIRITGLRAS
ncbi:hypothetical protein GCM10009819_31190 [Agromyces tropicus]|uniref:Uncharacterized protein n=1 Tax=Agromyces tropicus TaxID=555371 RepID=A0ABN2US69_9MICO